MRIKILLMQPQQFLRWKDLWPKLYYWTHSRS